MSISDHPDGVSLSALHSGNAPQYLFVVDFNRSESVHVRGPFGAAVTALTDRPVQH